MGTLLNTFARECHNPTQNDRANSAKKLPVSSCHSSRDARRSGAVTPARAASKAGRRGAAVNAGRPVFLGTSTVAVRGYGCAGWLGDGADAASTASIAVRAASRAPLPRTRPNLTRSIRRFYGRRETAHATRHHLLQAGIQSACSRMGTNTQECRGKHEEPAFGDRWCLCGGCRVHCLGSEAG